MRIVFVLRMAIVIAFLVAVCGLISCFWYTITWNEELAKITSNTGVYAASVAVLLNWIKSLVEKFIRKKQETQVAG